MTEPNEPTTPDEPADVVEEATEAIEFTDPPKSTDETEAEAADADADASAVAEDQSAAEASPEPVTLPDESNSRTTELAARLRQSALAQVEAAQAARSAEGDSPHTPSAEADAPAGSAIPALDDPQTVDRPVTRDPQPVPEPVAEPLSEPLAVAAAAVAEAQATGSQSFLSGPQEPERRRAAGPVMLATIAAAVLAIAAVVVLVISARSSAHDHAVEKARAAALAAAKPEVAAALTYDYRTLNSDFAKAETGMSTKFKANYARTAAGSVTPLATSTDAISTGTVADAGVISASTSTVRVLVFADQTAQNKKLGDKSRLDRSVIEVTMVKQGDRWVIDGLKPF
ncbi:MAG TPA: hypothetical protein VHV76_07955 [Mycobacteriales bacterium]|jgi:Mce-associated membrane protein|nr:hypothetical protein [Mycobacteriales bacterium]